MNIFGFNIDKSVILAVIAAVFGLSFLFSFIALVMSVKANKRMKKFVNYNKRINILDAVTNYYDKCKEIENSFLDADDRLKRLERESGASIKKVGTIRYDAFDENNGNLSFAAALLDESDNGFVINGVNSRGNTTTYLKSIREGKSVYALSDEEMQAIYIAKEDYESKTKID